MNKRILRAAIAATAMMGVAAPAAATVTYTFTSTTPGAGSFTYTAPTFITSNTAVDSLELDSCTVSAGSCTGAIFEPGALMPNGTVDEIFFSYAGDANGYGYEFAPGTFGTVGTFATGPISFAGTLTISANGVPEPATWAMMLVGLGLVGGSMRIARRRQRVPVRG